MEEKKLTYIIWDIISNVVACTMAIVLISEGSIDINMSIPTEVIIVTIIFMIISIYLKTYSAIWRFIGFGEVLQQLKVSTLTGIIILLLGQLNLIKTNIYMVIVYVGVVFGITCLGRISSRYKRWKYLTKKSKKENYKNTLIIGAGEAGSIVIKGLMYIESGLKPVAILDDEKNRTNKKLSGIPVVGKTNDLAKVVEQYKIEEIIVAMPSANKSIQLHICESALSLGISPKIFSDPTDVHEFVHGNINSLKKISIEDILSRDEVKADMTKVFELLDGKEVLITGGAGSIGSELCRQVLENGCKNLAIVDINENGLFELNEELKGKYSNYKIYLASVRDIKRISNIIKQEKPNLVIHAAAHKHVPIVNENPFEAIKNNYVGTRNVIEACIDTKVDKFVLVSTDKAVRPTNVMGATKRMAELLVQIYNGKNNCQMTAVRFGNVLGSAGSVIPLFKKQISEGGPITLTDKKMMRYFMTIPEAVSLVLSAGALAQGGELFVLNMGEPVNIYEIAKKMIILSGLEPHKDIAIKEIGIRPGEKLYEELTVEGENIEPTQDEKIYKVKSREIEQSWVQQEFDEILKLSLEEKDEKALITAINRFIEQDNKINDN